MTEIDTKLEEWISLCIERGENVTRLMALEELRDQATSLVDIELESEYKRITEELAKLKADTLAAESRLAEIAGTVQPKRKTRSDAGKPRAKKEGA